MGMVDRPTCFRQIQGVGENDVTVLPTRQELLLEVVERSILALITKEVGKKINAVIQEGYIRVTDIFQGSKSQAYHIGPITFEVFYGACK